jgi:hypothetical protein
VGVRLYTLRRAWTSLLVVGVPVSVLSLAWSVFMGGRATVAGLAFVYLLIVACGRAHAIKRERDELPHRERRVTHQLARIRSTLPGVEEPASPFTVVAAPAPADQEPEFDDSDGGGRVTVEGLRLRAV